MTEPIPVAFLTVGQLGSGYSNSSGHLPIELFGILYSLRYFVKEPFSALCLVQNVLEQVAGWRVPILVAYYDCIAYHLCDVAIIFHQDPNHLSGCYQAAVVVFYGLELTYMTDASYGRAAYSSNAFCHYVD